jgi:hypothetical protein
VSEWRVAQSLVTFIHQCNTAFPGRSRASDGTIGDARHRAETHSDHNPNAAGVVTAFDLTHDPAHGADIAVVSEQLRKSKDPRIKYVIANRRIFDGPGQNHPAWQWHTYTGSDPHVNHLHISVSADPHKYDDVNPWHLPVFGDDMALDPAERKALIEDIVNADLHRQWGTLNFKLSDGTLIHRDDALRFLWNFAHGLNEQALEMKASLARIEKKLGA